MKIALKIDVETYRGTRDGVPRLLELLKRYDAHATFFFTFGPDRSGRGVFCRRPRVSFIEHYGFAPLLYGTLLPAPDITANCADIMKRVRDEGFEVGCRENIAWRKHVARRDAAWTQQAMQHTVAQFTEVFGEAPKAHSAAEWQINRDALRLTQRLGFDYASDTRGSHPFTPTWDAEIVACPQLPTTLPTLDELIGRNGHTRENAVAHLLALSMNPPASGHVFTLRAEIEGGKWLPLFEQLLEGWQRQGCNMLSLREYLESLDGTLPRHEIKMRGLDGRAGEFATQV